MNTVSPMPSWAAPKASELGLPQTIFSTALDMIFKNRHLVNAIDNGAEMDDYIYRDVIRNLTNERRLSAEAALNSSSGEESRQAMHDLAVLSREELITDPFYRAVLPLLVKVVSPEPIRRLHAEEASAIILLLADVKRKHRATTLTEVIVKRCGALMAEEIEWKAGN